MLAPDGKGAAHDPPDGGGGKHAKEHELGHVGDPANLVGHLLPGVAGRGA